MSTAVLELNDQALLIKNQGGEVFCEPGYALHTEQGIITGIAAQQQAWLQPQNSYREYWRQLNQASLPGNHRWARHHADIAFAQLRSLHTKAGSPEQLILCVPGTYDDQQLSLILGLMKALKTSIVAIVDSSLADCLYLEDVIGAIKGAEKQTLHVDLQMHQMVVSQISFERRNLRIQAQQVFPDIGAGQINNALASFIRDQAIRHHRFDPLHTSEGEQAIYDQLPEFTRRITGLPECHLSISSPRGELQLLLRKKDIEELLAPRLESLSRLMDKTAARDITFSHNAKLIAAVHSGFSGLRELNRAQGIDNCLSYQQSLIEKSENLHRITAIQEPQIASGRRRSDTQPPASASHLLYQGRAWPLNEPLSIAMDGKRLTITPLVDNSAVLVISADRQGLNIIHRDSAINIDLPDSAEPGGKIFIGDYQLLLIEVCNG